MIFQVHHTQSDVFAVCGATVFRRAWGMYSYANRINVQRLVTRHAQNPTAESGGRSNTRMMAILMACITFVNRSLAAEKLGMLHPGIVVLRGQWSRDYSMHVHVYPPPLQPPS